MNSAARLHAERLIKFQSNNRNVGLFLSLCTKSKDSSAHLHIQITYVSMTMDVSEKR